MSRRDGRLVYSSERGQICPNCGLPVKGCVCRANPRGAQDVGATGGDGVVRIRREVKGRRGKTVTTIAGVALPDDDLRELAGALKRRCGSGGALKQGVIEIQGDHCDVLIEELTTRGFQVKRAGG